MTDSATSLVELYTRALKCTTKYWEWVDATIKALPGEEEMEWVENYRVPSRKLKPVEYPDCWYIFKDCYMSDILGSIASYKTAELEPANCLIDRGGLLEKLSYIETKLKEKINQGTRGTGEGDKQSGQLAITQKEKTEHPLIARYTDYLNTVREYYHTLSSAPYVTSGSFHELDTGFVTSLIKHTTLVAWSNKVKPLSDKVQEIYALLKSDLGLPYDFPCLAWEVKDIRDKDGDVRDKLRKIEQRLIELIKGQEWELEKEALTAQKETPGARGEATESSTYQWEIDRNTRKITLSTSKGVKTYKPERKALFSIFEKLWDNEGTPISLKELCKVTNQERGYARDYVIDLKNQIAKDLKIPRDVVEEIIKRYPSTGKIKHYTFHKNPL